VVPCSNTALAMAVMFPCLFCRLHQLAHSMRLWMYTSLLAAPVRVCTADVRARLELPAVNLMPADPCVLHFCAAVHAHLLLRPIIGLAGSKGLYLPLPPGAVVSLSSSKGLRDTLLQEPAFRSAFHMLCHLGCGC
jgi:hypothetical protein